MTPAVRKEYDIMAAKLTSMYGAKWDKDSKARKMVIRAAEKSVKSKSKEHKPEKPEVFYNGKK